MNRYLVKFLKNVVVEEHRIIDAYTIVDAKAIVLVNDFTDIHSDQFVVEDNEILEIIEVKHLKMLEVSQ